MQPYSNHEVYNNDGARVIETLEEKLKIVQQQAFPSDCEFQDEVFLPWWHLEPITTDLTIHDYSLHEGSSGSNNQRILTPSPTYYDFHANYGLNTYNMLNQHRSLERNLFGYSSKHETSQTSQRDSKISTIHLYNTVADQESDITLNLERTQKLKPQPVETSIATKEVFSNFVLHKRKPLVPGKRLKSNKISRKEVFIRDLSRSPDRNEEDVVVYIHYKLTSWIHLHEEERIKKVTNQFL